MSIASSPGPAQRIAQTIDNLRITDEEFKIKAEECNQLRHQLNEAHQSVERLQLLLRKQENISASRQEECIKTKHSLDIVLKELTTKQQSIDALQHENARLKRDLESSQHHAGEVTKTLQTKSLSKEVLGGLRDSPSALYVQQCFHAGCDPHTDIVRGLHQGHAIEAVKCPVSFQQLNALSEVFEMMRSLDPLNAANVVVRRFALAVESEESLVLMAHMIRAHTTIADVEIHGLGSFAASEVAAALATSDHIATVSLPNLRVNDVAFQSVMKVVNNREQLFVASERARAEEISAAKAAKNEALVDFLSASSLKHNLLSIEQLDLSQSFVKESTSFELIRGQAMRSINLSGCCCVLDAHVGEILRGCPQLESIDLSRCPQLTNDTVGYINASKSIRKANLLGCPGMSKLNFFFIETLLTDLSGVSHLECPALRCLPTPITHLSLVALNCPVLEEITFRGLALCDRELRLVAESSPALTKLHFIKCRLQGAEFFFRVLRNLTDLALHACRSVTDQEVMSLCSQLRVLDLTDAYCLTDRSMKYLGERCSQLTHLTLKRCANITDQGLQCYAQHAALEFLNVLGTKKITIVGLHRVLGTLPSMRRVVHETLVSATIHVDRDDAEEAEKLSLDSQQAILFAKREGAVLNYLAQTSPMRAGHQRSDSAIGTAATPIAPRPPTSSDVCMTSPKSLKLQQQTTDEMTAAQENEQQQPAARDDGDSHPPSQEGATTEPVAASAAADVPGDLPDMVDAVAAL